MNQSLSRSQAVQYDESCTKDFGITALVLITHAAVECAAIIRHELLGDSAKNAPDDSTFVVALCGGGNNGADGYAIIRTLHSHGIDAVAIEVAPCLRGSDANIMRESAQRMGLVHPWSNLSTIVKGQNRVVIVDALFGTGLSRAPTGPLLDAIHWINARASSGTQVYAIDLPSGLDCDSGKTLGSAKDAVFATRTLTMVAKKSGFSADSAQAYLGTITEIPIGGPPITRRTQIVE
ncbi:MAG: NAD(P)H-hydrate epimerase [Planctomycetota bacterium]|nr:NAD(P)H-hydrate epimerase [Planctomycetota bacterium]MDA1262696.1 NAD(P)H-hydrate epimerase [Planctomycetota bacterium]